MWQYGVGSLLPRAAHVRSSEHTEKRKTLWRGSATDSNRIAVYLAVPSVGKYCFKEVRARGVKWGVSTALKDKID